MFDFPWPQFQLPNIQLPGGYEIIQVLALIAAILGIYLLYRIIRVAAKAAYFSGPSFKREKARLAPLVAEHNEIAEHFDEVRRSGIFYVGESRSFTADLAPDRVSTFRSRREGPHKAHRGYNVYNGSLQIVRAARNEPTKYLCKYFNITPHENTIRRLEIIGDQLAQLEETAANLELREAAIRKSMRAPWFINWHYRDDFLDRIDLSDEPISVPYPVYIFEYVSPRGDAAEQTRITLKVPEIESLTENLSRQAMWRSHAQSQRALMTQKLREEIKRRDNHTCQSCGLSLYDEPNLLLHVDHIVPISRGGMSTRNNLQTLCWRCNLTKSDQIV